MSERFEANVILKFPGTVEETQCARKLNRWNTIVAPNVREVMNEGGSRGTEGSSGWFMFRGVCTYKEVLRAHREMKKNQR